jgi:trigger factor
VEVTFPEGYPGGLGGQRAQFDVTVHEVKAKRLPELDDDFATDAGGFDTIDELREDVRRQLTEEEAHRIEHEFEAAVIEAAVSEAELDVPEELIHARAHELLEDTFRSLARRGISKEAYLRITDRDEETLAHEAQPEAAEALRREAVLAAVVEAEGIEPSDEDVLEALGPTAEREGRPAQELLDQLRTSGGLEPVRAEVAGRRAVELLVREAKPISVEQAKARKKLWTPGKEPAGDVSADPAGQLWTPGQ